MNLERLLEWVLDLEKTTDEQTKGTLFDGIGYCCLGRLCRVMDLEFQVVDPEFEGSAREWEVVGDGSISFAPFDKVSEFLELTDEEKQEFDQAFYSDLNDNQGLTFPQIAAAIRDRYNLGDAR